LLDRKLRVAEKGAQKGRETCPFCALDGFNEIRLTALKRMAGTTRLELATSAVTATTYNNARTAKIPVSRTRHRILWVGLWVENLFPRCPPRAVFIAPHQLGMHSLRLALRRSGNYSLTDCLSDFGPASLRVHPGHNFLVARHPPRIRLVDALPEPGILSSCYVPWLKARYVPAICCRSLSLAFSKRTFVNIAASSAMRMISVD